MKHFIRSYLRKAGMDIVRFGSKKILQELSIDCIIDIGANEGQYAKETRRIGYAGKIISIEPTKKAHSALEKNACGDVNWEIYQRCALGNIDGETLINIAGNSVSSSILEMGKQHKETVPASQYVAQEKVTIKRLDDIFESCSNGSNNILLKIDVQGFEREVLAGAKKSIPQIAAVRLELSLTELYVGETLFSYYIDLFNKFGFDLWDIQPGFRDPKTGRLLQFDGTFVKSKLSL